MLYFFFKMHQNARLMAGPAGVGAYSAANKDRQKRNIFDLAFLTLYNVFSFECFFLN